MEKEKVEDIKEDKDECVDEQESPAQDKDDVSEETANLSLEDQLKVANEEAQHWKTEYYKVFADMENLKRRLQTEHANALKYMMQSFVEDLLPVLDNLERSLNVENPSDEVKSFLTGYEMITKQLMDALSKHGVEYIEVEGKEFDPNLHQAVMMVEDENFESNMIVEELQKGYKLKDRVIRASLVKVNG